MLVFFFNDTATTEIYTLSLHDALPISLGVDPSDHLYLDQQATETQVRRLNASGQLGRSEEHTSELQSPCNLVCRLLLEKKNEGLLSLRRLQQQALLRRHTH